MVKRICDRCNREIKGNYWTIDIYEKEDRAGMLSTKGAINNFKQNTNKILNKEKEYCKECIEEVTKIIDQTRKNNNEKGCKNKEDRTNKGSKPPQGESSIINKEQSLYKQVKNLFQTSEEAREAYLALEYCTQHKAGDVLYIFTNRKEAKEAFSKAIALTQEITYDKQRLIINFDNYKVYYKTINELKNKLEGYRFKEIKFIEEG